MKCPGQDSRFWGKDAIFEAKCPECGKPVEFFKDEPSRRCRNCGHKFVNPRMDFGCAAYCKFADQCLGELPPELLAQREHLLKDRVAVEAKKRYGRNFSAIALAVKAARYAEELLKNEGGELPVVIIAAHLHRLPERPESKNPSPDESARAAEELLRNISQNEELIRKITNLIGKRGDEPDPSDLNHSIFHDALLLASLDEAIKKNPERTLEIPPFRTQTAKKIAEQMLAK